MNDRQAIEQAYSAQLQAIFNTFVSTCATGGDQASAEAHFKSGVALLRKVRDLAIANL
jgi:hypothetical protein